LVRDEQVAPAVQRHPVRIVQLGAGGELIVAVIAVDAGAGDSSDEASARIHPAYPLVVAVVDEQVAPTVHCHPVRKVQLSAGSGLMITVVAVDAGAGAGGDGAHDGGNTAAASVGDRSRTQPQCHHAEHQRHHGQPGWCVEPTSPPG